MRHFKIKIFIGAPLIGFLVSVLMIPLALGYASRLELVRIKTVDTENRNLIIERKWDGKTWLLHYKGPCITFSTDQTITLTIEGDLDAGRDEIKLNDHQSCPIDRAEEVNGTVYVESVFNSETFGIVRDEEGRRFFVTTNHQCGAFRGYIQKNVYVQRFGNVLGTNDMLRIPGTGPECYFSHVEPITQEAENLDVQAMETAAKKAEEGGASFLPVDVKRPTSVPNVRAIPSKTGVYLYWQPARDNVGVDHYIVSYSLYHIDTRNRDFDGMPNKTVVRGRTHKMEGLDSDELYFFYIVAVDAAGNVSSDWSEEAKAHTKSAIHEYGFVKPQPINIRRLQETSGSVLFSWSQIPVLDRQQVILRADGAVDTTWNDFTDNKLRISKTTARLGKTLTLTVKNFDLRGSQYETTFEFSF